jgi:hypothetical protein
VHAFYVKFDQNYGLRATKNQQEIKLLVDSITGTRICQPIKRQKFTLQIGPLLLWLVLPFTNLAAKPTVQLT